MAFCSGCGSQIENEINFCADCGTPTADRSVKADQRQQEYYGKIIKCPNCGEVLKSFAAICPACGFEVRDVKASSTVSELARKLEAIEATRKSAEPIKYGFFETVHDESISSTDAQKISLIKSFPVPNTKEDILELMFLVSSTIDTSAFGSMWLGMDKSSDVKYEIASAWLSKLKHVYSKAYKSFGKDDDFSLIIELYNSCMEEVDKQKKRRFLKWVPVIAFFALIVLFSIIIVVLN